MIKNERYGTPDSRKWINELKKRGIKEFEFKDLPKELKVRGSLSQAAISKQVESIGKNKKGISLWRVI